MALIARVSRLFKADLHAVLDQLEEPASLLKQSIREMEDALAERERELKQLEIERSHLRKRAADQHKLPAEIDAKLDLCFASDNEELAKKLTRRKLQAQRLALHISTRLETLDAAIAEQRSVCDEDRERLELMRQKAECLVEPPASGGETSIADEDLAVADDEVEIAFLAEKQSRSGS